MPIVCPNCGDEFQNKKAMRIHKSKVHSGKKKVVKKAEQIERVNTGVEGFDKLTKEGIPKGSSVLIEGGPGSGKTIFCLQIAKNAVERGEKALYMSFEEPVKRLVQHMDAFNWDVEEYMENDKLRIERYNALDIARSVEALLSEAKKELMIDVKPMLFPEDFEPDVVLFDSLTSVASAFSGRESRFRIYMEQLFQYLEKKDITSYLIRETPNPSHIGMQVAGPGGGSGAVSFLSDGIVAIYNAIHPSGKRDRGLEIVKMRGEDFQSGIVKMEIKDNEGIIVYPDENLEGEYTLT
ncbi:MAG: ATPase domain-containing protein [Candidatus Nanohaloarchaea archaeon]|nr:ATPase domain-containing protein [Candidatus Nanohaloarchaea archaeon]